MCPTLRPLNAPTRSPSGRHQEDVAKMHGADSSTVASRLTLLKTSEDMVKKRSLAIYFISVEK